MQLQGRAVFPGTVVGPPYLWDVGGPLSRDNIIVAGHLSNEIALAAIEAKVRGIVTEEGSFATHGANLLRSAFAFHGYLPVWITDVKGACCLLYGQNELQLYSNGLVASTTSGSSAYEGSARERYIARPPREIIKLGTRSGELARAYWPHRHYDVLTASIMIPGLEDACRRITGRVCSIERSRDGILWFSGTAPSLQELKALAKDPRKSKSYLNQQIATYRELYRTLQSAERNGSQRTEFSLHQFVKCIEVYFSVLLLYHNTYEDVFAKLAVLLHHRVGDSGLDRVMNRLLHSKLSDWQLETRIALRNPKDLLAETSPVALPPFSVDDDLNAAHVTAVQAINELASEYASTFSDSEKEYVQYASDVFVVKEWKFVMNKVLYSRFGSKASEMAAKLESGDELADLSNWRRHDVRYVLHRLGGA